MQGHQGNRLPEDSHGDALKTKMAELMMTKEEVKMARDSVTQSWLDSKPLIDELEKLQSGLESAKNQSSNSDAVISQLRLCLQSIGDQIRSKKKEELKASRMISEISQAMEQTREELEKLQLETGEEQEARLKLKQVLRIRKQALRASQLRLRAIQIETEAFQASAAFANRHIDNSDMMDDTIKLTREEYSDMRERAKEEELLAQWRISVSMEQKIAAEESLNVALKRSLESHSNRSRRRKKEGNIIEDGDAIKGGERRDSSDGGEGTEDNDGGIALLKPQANIIAGKPRQSIRKSKGHTKRKPLRQRKPSILRQIRSFFVRLFH